MPIRKLASQQSMTIEAGYDALLPFSSRQRFFGILLLQEPRVIERDLGWDILKETIS